MDIEFDLLEEYFTFYQLLVQDQKLIHKEELSIKLEIKHFEQYVMYYFYQVIRYLIAVSMLVDKEL